MSLTGLLVNAANLSILTPPLYGSNASISDMKEILRV